MAIASDYFGYSYKNATSHDVLRFYWECSNIDTTNNRSTVKWQMYLTSDMYGKIASTANKKWSVTINGTKYSGTNTIAIGQSDETILASGTTVIPHNANGSKTFSFTYSQEFNITFSGKQIGTISNSDTGELALIPRSARLTSAVNFNDEQNPTIAYSNPAGNYVEALDACISFTGTAADVPYRAISKTGTSYTFNLTNAERKTLRNGITDGHSRTVRFYVRTTIAGKTYYSVLNRTLTLVNGDVEINPESYDSNPATVALTNNNQKYIRYHSKVSYDLNINLKKEATVKKIEVTNSGITKNTETGEFTGVTERTINYYVVDNRGTSQDWDDILCNPEDFIEYIHPTCSIAATQPTTTGEMTITANGKCYSGSFGAVNNEVTVIFRYKEENGDYVEVEVPATLNSDNTYTASATITGLDYTKVYRVNATATDKLETKDSSEIAIKTKPVYDYGKDDFKFNVPVYDMYGNQLDGIRFIWGHATGYYMNGSQSINLTQTVSSQTNGLVFVFSRFNPSTAKPYDEFVSHFIPRKVIEGFDGAAHNFFCANGDFTAISNKKLYIYNDRIVGDNVNVSNSNATTGAAFAFSNNNYVLRYIYGV